MLRTAWFTFGVAVLCGLSELLAGPAYRVGWIGLGAGLQTMRWMATGAAVVLPLALLGAALARRRQVPRASAVFLVSSAISLLAAIPPAVLWYRVQQLPRLHDISTDTENPPQYVSILPLRSAAANPSTYDSQLAALQVQAYPEVAPVLLAAPPEQAFQKALAVARAMGWEIVAAEPNTLRIEATDTSLLFGFKDDVVIRIKSEAGGSRVDLRSLSRVGKSDFGVNAKRIRRFIARLKEAA
jgi:uncharacterized protein (DUF1499 family)